MSKRWMTLFVLLAAFAAVAAACASDDTEADTGDDTADETEADETSGDDTTDEPTDDTDDPDAGGDDTVEADTDVELTDSFRGVTADTILVGSTSVDFAGLRDLGVDIVFSDFNPIAQAIADWYNDNGGVLGRQIELVDEVFLPVGPTEAEESCLRLTEDNEVFAVINGFAGPGAEDVNVCLTEQHETILVGGLPSEAQMESSGGLWVTEDMSLDRRNPAVVDLLVETGEIDDLGPIMVVGSSPDEEELVENMADDLRDAGAEVTATTWVTDIASGDQNATNSEVEVMISRARSDGAETIFMLGEGEFRNQAFFDIAPDFTYFMGNGDRITDWQSIPPEGLQEGTRVLTNTGGPAPIDDPQVQECVEAVEAALGVEVLPTEELPEGEENYWSGTLGSCRRLAIFVQIAEAAGPDLTNESWVAALDEVDLSVPGWEFVSLSSDKTDVRDTLVLAEYDLDTLTFEPIGDPVDVG